MIRTRFAPSPTGFMHIGNLRTGLYAYLFARHGGGQFILRIEDTDRERYVDGAVEVVYNTLKEAGITHDEGPDVGGEYGPYVQSERMSIYKEYAHKLVETGGAYVCFCTKERLESLTDANGNRKYDKHCLALSKEEVASRIAAGESYVIRQNIPTEGVSEYDDLVYGHISVACSDMEDNVLLKSDGMPTYNFANVVDDHLMKINYVIRGSEYLSSTPKYNLVYDAFGWERPNYIHLPPIMKDATRKLSKRYGDANFDDFIKQGYLPQAIVNYIALLGWSPKTNDEIMSFEKLTEQFNLEGLNKSSSIFDAAKMKWMNGEYLRALSAEEFLAVATPFLRQSKVHGLDYAKLCKLLQKRVEILSEIAPTVDFLAEYDSVDPALYVNAKQKTDASVAKAILPLCATALADTEWTEESVYAALLSTAEQGGYKKGQVIWCFRIAITNKENTPGGATEMADLLGKTETMRRLNKAIADLN